MTGPGDVIARAVAAGDLDALVRLVGGLCASRDWEGVVQLRDRARAAVERGLQLWPAADYAEYRLALEAPGGYAGAVVVPGAGRFALGPLWEVAASTHAWAELAPHLPPGPSRSLAAHERVLRGEDLSDDATIDRGILELPLRLEDWEPHYPPAVFHADRADFPTPALPPLRRTVLPPGGVEADDRESLEALLDLGRVWAQESNGAVAAVAVEGSAAGAIASLGVSECLLAETDGATALAWMAWAGASGGAYGRRRGSPTGRFTAWWAVVTLTGLPWPADPDAVGEALQAMRWWAWEPLSLAPGWGLHLAMEVPGEGLAFAAAARDRQREPEVGPAEGRQPAGG